MDKQLRRSPFLQIDGTEVLFTTRRCTVGSGMLREHDIMNSNIDCKAMLEFWNPTSVPVVHAKPKKENLTDGAYATDICILVCAVFAR